MNEAIKTRGLKKPDEADFFFMGVWRVAEICPWQGQFLLKEDCLR
jgi:hypothetical protein